MYAFTSITPSSSTTSVGTKLYRTKVVDISRNLVNETSNSIYNTAFPVSNTNEVVSHWLSLLSVYWLSAPSELQAFLLTGAPSPADPLEVSSLLGRPGAWGPPPHQGPDTPVPSGPPGAPRAVLDHCELPECQALLLGRESTPVAGPWREAPR